MCGKNSRQLVGFILIWVAAGMIFMVLLPNDFVGVLTAAGFFLLGYSLCRGYL